jgi:hypothetical protein
METLANFLGWLLIANIAFLAFRVFIFGSTPKSFVYKIHSHFFKVSHKDFALTHYRAIVHHVTLIVFFNLLPYLVLRALI